MLLPWSLARQAGLAKGFSMGCPAIAAVIVGAVVWPIGNAVKAQLEQGQKNITTSGSNGWLGRHATRA